MKAAPGTNTISPGFRIALATALALGALLRLGLLLRRGSLWIDELLLSLNLAARSLLELLRPLDYQQTAPVLFLWAERLAIRIAGVHGLALRAVPFAAGVLIPLALWRVARRLVGPAPALVATAIAAVSPILVHYSAQVKPYGVDALLTVLLLDSVLATVEEPDSGGAWWRLLIWGALAVCGSTPAPLVLAGVVAGLAACPAVRSTPGHRSWLLAAAVLWCVLFAAVYLGFERHAVTNAYLQRFWAAAMLVPQAPDLGLRASIAASETLRSIFLGDRPPMAAALPAVLLFFACAAGLLRIARSRGPWAAVLLVGPIASALAVSMAGLYPIAPRLMLFASPLLILLLAEGLAAATALLPERPAPIGLAVLTTLLLVPALRSDIRRILHPLPAEEAGAVIADFEARHVPGEPVYVSGRGIPAWLFYTTDWSNPDQARLTTIARAVDVGGPAFYPAPSRGRSVRDEGRDLVFAYRGRRELLGIPTGIEVLYGAVPASATPDAGWAENEAARIRSEARPYAWVFFAHLVDGSEGPLRNALERAGGRLVYRYEAEGAVIDRYRFE